MDKKIIKNHLTERFISEETTPGISVTNKAKKESEKINKAGVKAVAKDSLDYNKDLKADTSSKMPINKFNYTNDFEKTYHDEMEIMNGQEMIQYDRTPSKEFKEKAKEGIEGSSRMGNKGGKGMGNAEAHEGVSSDDFGKNLVKKIEASEKKRSEQTPTLNLRGRDIQADIKDTGHKPYAFGKDNVKENKNNNPQIKESMKRLKFNKDGKNPFNGFGNALKLIPEVYRTDKKEFEMTDGNETYRIRWEGTLTEGKAIILSGKDAKLVNEDIARMKVLFGYKSQDTLGLVKGNARLDENAAFTDIYNKTKKLLGESDDIEDEKAAEGEVNVPVAKEAKKDIEGSVSTDKGTEAPKPKVGNWEDISVPQASEAKKHVEGSVATVKKTEAPAPKVGEFDKINVPQAAEAKKDIESGNATHTATSTKPKTGEWDKINENEEEIDEPEVEDNFLKPDADDASPEEKEPTAKDLSTELPIETGDDDDDTAAIPAAKGSAKLMKSTSKGTYYIMVGTNAIEVAPNYVELAKKNKANSAMLQSIITKMQDEADSAPEADEEGLDEGFDPALATNLEKQFDELNAKLGGKETANKMKWLARAKENNYKGTFNIQKGRNGYFIIYNAKDFMPATGGSSGFGTANENDK